MYKVGFLIFKHKFWKYSNKKSLKNSELGHYWQSESKRFAVSLCCLYRPKHYFSLKLYPRGMYFFSSPSHSLYFWWQIQGLKPSAVEIMAAANKHKQSS